MHPFVGGLPGPQTAVSTAHRIVSRDGRLSYLAGGRIIDGTKSRDTGNTSDLNVLRAGLPMGKITSSGKFANSIMGLTDAAYAGGATSLTLTAAAATELNRRVGSSGTFTIVGPPAASGTVNAETVTYSAVNTTTGVVTVTALGNSYISGSYVMPTDGSQDIKTVIPDGYGINVFLGDGATAADQPFPKVPIGGVLVASMILFYPSDTSMKAWFRSQLSFDGEGQFVIDDTF